MPEPTLVLVVVLVAVVAMGVWLASRIGRGPSSEMLLILKTEIEAARSEARQIQETTLTTVRGELHHLRTEMAGHMGQVGSGVQQQLQHVTEVVGNVQGSLGKLGEATQRVMEVGKDIAGLEQILKSPKVRGGLGETLLEQLLAQMLPREHYEPQYAFRSGEKVDAVVRIAGHLVPVDAKFPLENFRRMLAEPEEERRRALRKAFGRCLLEQGDPGGALDQLDSAARMDPDDLEVLKWQGRAARALSKSGHHLSEAVAYLESARMRLPADPEIPLLLSEAYAASGRPDEAMSAAEQAVSLAPGTRPPT